jgi:Cu(I)/Ag(I) efflux system membrane protein CusA/SilA
MSEEARSRSPLAGAIAFFLENRLVVAVLLALTVAGGLYVAPFDYELGGLPRSPVPVDAIPDIGENQQIVFTEWEGRSPQDVEDQVTYPLTVALLGVPGVKTIRSSSFFGYSSVYVVFDEGVEFYWSRSRVLEKLSSLPPGTLPEGVRPALGPDATALGQVFWYTLEGEGFSLHELRSIQDFTVRYALLSAGGVAEVASVGGYVREYQVDVDPDALKAHGVTLRQVFEAVRRSNVDVGARTIEVNRVEYLVRGVGFLESAEDLERTVIVSRENVPLTVGQVAHVSLGPATRRGALDREGAEAVGGVVVVRHGENPLRVIRNVKERIAEIAPGLPRRTLEDGRVSQVRIVPFYDRTQLIHETLGTLEEALSHEILITALVVIVMLLHLRSALLVSGLLPLAVLLAFLAMRLAGVDANVMSLSGIAIAIGTMVDMGIVVTENVVGHLERAGPQESRLEVVRRGASEVGGAVLTATATTVVSFLPVFTLLGPEGKLFRPLAFTKTFALLGAAFVALVFIPPLAYLLLRRRPLEGRGRPVLAALTVALGLLAAARLSILLGVAVILFGLYQLLAARVPEAWRARVARWSNLVAALVVGVVLTRAWLPLGPGRGLTRNLLFVLLLVGGVLLLFLLFRRVYEPLLRLFLRRKLLFAVLPLLVVLTGACVWLGFDRVVSPAARVLGPLGVIAEELRQTRLWKAGAAAFPGLGREFMPPLDEGSFLLMPTTMPHASLGEALDQMQTMDMALRAIPEVETVVGKLGRVDSPLDPAPVSMFETVINYRSEYRRDPVTGRRVLDEDGRPIRQWREHIRSPEDIWEEIAAAASLPGLTAAPRLQPIAARLVMLQSGMRAPMGVKIQGPSLEAIESLGFEIERLLKEVPGVKPDTVVADRVVGKPYLEIAIDRDAIARYGVNVRDVQDVIEIAVGGKTITRTVEGRERYPVRVRYQRELRDSIESLGRILVPASDGSRIPLTQLAEVSYTRGPMVIKSEDTFLTSYVLFDRTPERSEVEVVEAAAAHLSARVADGSLRLPAGTSYSFAGTYESQVRSQKTLALVLPAVLAVIFLLLYLQFRRASTAALVFSGVLVAWAGGFLLLGLYGTSWFLDFALFGVNLRDLFQVHPVNLSVAVWVGFIALFGIATDDGVLMGTYLEQSFARRAPTSREEAREATVRAALRRVRPCLMTAGTTLLALVPVITSSGRGSDVMAPMALPVFGGMVVVLLTLFVVPVFYCALRERGLARGGGQGD